MKFHLLHFSLLILLFSGCGSQRVLLNNSNSHLGAITRGDNTERKIALVFTGHEFAEGGQHIIETLEAQQSRASFFFTGDFYRDPEFSQLINSLVQKGHYLGAHSDKHLLYCDWNKRDSLLVTREEFSDDLLNNYKEMKRFGIDKEEAPYFLPPYEWYNDSISSWTREQGLQLINFTHGTLSHADYTTPSMPNYRSSREIDASIITYESRPPSGLKGLMLLVHIGAGPERTDKFYLLLENLMAELKDRGYTFVRVDELPGMNMN